MSTLFAKSPTNPLTHEENRPLLSIHRILDIIHQPRHQRPLRTLHLKRSAIQPPKARRQDSRHHVDAHALIRREEGARVTLFLVEGRGAVAGEGEGAVDGFAGDVLFGAEGAAEEEGEEVVGDGFGVGEVEGDGGVACRVGSAGKWHKSIR